MRSSRIFVLAVVVATLSIACQRQKTGYLEVRCQVLPSPARVGSADVRITLTDSRHLPIHAEQVSVEADMSHPGMKPVFQKALPVSPNEYRCGLNFDMPGDWTLTLHAQLTNGERVDNQVNVVVLER